MERNFLYNLADNFIGYDDGVMTPGERAGAGVNALARGIWRDPLGMARNALMGIKGDLDNLMFEGGARERPEAVLGYAAAPMAPGAATGALMARTPNTLNAIKAWHGSPHDFDRFSMDKIGTGEGAQAYGHGLYFAENEGVARAYRDVLASKASSDPFRVTARAILAKHGGDKEKALAHLRMSAEAFGDTPRGNSFKFAAEALENGDSIDDVKGRLYEVEIDANPEDFLDWDAPMSAQPENLQEMARTADLSGLSGRMRNKFLHWRGEYDPPEIDGVQLVVPEPTGNDLHSILTDYGNDPARNAEMTRGLAGQGIPGIRYLDQGSRGAGDGTRNYVVFDENLIKIVNKYGIAGAAAMLGVSAAEVEAAMAGEQ